MRSLIRELTDRCWQIADTTADRNGFVPLRKLLCASDCQLITTPLLVEAAITTRLDEPSQWVVVLNSEIHRFSHESFELESSISPLGVRTRNTVAHEVAHKIAIDVIGMDLSKKGTLEERLAAVERTIEKISPLLLIPKAHLLDRLSNICVVENAIQKISHVSHELGVSRQIFISAIKLLNQCHRTEVMKIEGLSDAVWGVAEFHGKSKFSTRAEWTMQNLQKASSSESGKIVQTKKNIQWQVISFRNSDGRRFCQATSDALIDRNTVAEFEMERIPPNGRGKSFYRLPGVIIHNVTDPPNWSDHYAQAGPAVKRFAQSLGNFISQQPTA